MNGCNLKKLLYIGVTKERCRRFILDCNSNEYLIQAFTLSELAHKEFFQSAENLAVRLGSMLEKKILMRQAVQSSDLTFFDYLKDKDQQFSNTLEMFINFDHMISANKVPLAALGYSNDKLQDIRIILESYRKLLNTNNIATYCETLSYFKEYIEKSELAEYQKIILDQFFMTDVSLFGSSLEREVLESISSLKHTEIKDLMCKDTLAKVYLTRVFSRYDELTEVAKTILTLVKNGDNANDMIVTSSSLSEYMPYIYDVFQSYGIPIHISNGVPLKHTAMYAKIIARIKNCNDAESVLEFLNKQLQLKQVSGLIYYYQINRAVLYKVFETLKEGLSDGIPYDVIKKYIMTDMKDETVSSPSDGVQFQELNQLVGVRRKHVIIIGADSKNMPIKQTDNILYQAKQLEELFGQNNSYKLSSFHIDQIIQNNDNAYLIAPTADGKHSLELSQIISDKLRNTPDSFALDCEFSKNDLLKNNKRIMLDQDSEKFIQSVKSDNFAEFDGSLDGYKHEIGYMSISQLNRYADCPLNYFFSYVLSLRTPIDKEAGFDVMEKGTLMHAFLEKLALLIKNGDLKPPMTPDSEFIKSAITILNQAYEETITKADKDENIHHKIQYLSMVKGLDGELKSPGVISSFLDCFFDKDSNHYLLEDVYDVEHRIDSKTFSIEGVPINGAIDRIDKTDESIRLIDYKSSAKKDGDLFDKLKQLKSFQLPVYIMYCMAQIADNPDTVINAMLFSPAQKTEFSRIKHSGSTTTLITEKYGNLIEEALEGYLENVKSKIKSIWDDINSGKFSFSGDESVCKYCDFWSMCHKSVLQKEVCDEQV
jgi:ATP-dependent helicase/DNAse subunit B